MARLHVEQGKSQGKSVEFDRQAIIGRGETAQLQINDLKASREHFKVFEQAGTWSVADLNSRNGIKVNGVSTTRKTLSNGDKIEVGETVIVFQMTGAAATAKAAADASSADTGDMPAVRAAAPGARAPAPAAAARSSPPPAHASKPGDAGAKKAAAMAEARAAAQTAKAAPAATKASAAKGSAGKAAPTGKGLEVSDRVLQFHKVDMKKATVMDVDLTQSPATTKILIFLGCAAFLGLLAWLFSTLVQ